MPTPASYLRDSAGVVAGFGGSATSFAALDHAQLMAAIGAIADLRRHVDQFAALAAGEVAARSRRELGHQGMAQRAGFVSPVAMIQSVAQVSKHEATRMVEMGTVLADVEFSNLLLAAGSDSSDDCSGDGSDSAIGLPDSATAALAPDWQVHLSNALTEGRMSIDKVDAIRRVMTDLTPETITAGTTDGPAAGDRGASTSAAITLAVDELIGSASGLTPEQLFRAAKRARDVLDSDGIERREKQQRDLRSVRTWWDINGMHCGSWRLAPEDGTLVAEAFAQILSPRRGGPRFVNPEARATAEELLNDARTDEQIAADAFRDMIRLAVDADPGTLFGTRRPAVRVIITADQLTHPTGHGHLEGRSDSVSKPTIDRHLCDTGAISIGFDTDGQCVNVGRNQRLFTARQRVGLAARDGGCLFPGCERPPSYCEAHHINPWKQKHGKTDIADGILLCRRHHLLIHNNHWEVGRDQAQYFLTPPKDIDSSQSPIRLTSKSAFTLSNDRDIGRDDDPHIKPHTDHDIDIDIDIDHHLRHERQHA